MKFLLAALFILPLTANADQEFAGFATSSSLDSCEDAKDPSPEVAERNSAAEAQKFCGTFSMIARRISPFTHLNTCVNAGSGFGRHFLKTATASAMYKCESSGPAGTRLGGTYHLESACTIGISALGDVEIPAGVVVVTENIPVQNEGGNRSVPQESPAIIFQSNGDFHAVLTLKNGRVAKPTLGQHSFSRGTYRLNGENFLEQFGTYDGVSERVHSSIELSRTDSGLVLTSRPGFMQPESSCALLK